MKNVILGMSLALLLGAIYSTPIQAQTYDGVTPAEETVCGELMADGVTKGLYGLCVAYCEAQDGLSYEEVGSRVSDYEYDTDDTLLEVYNKRKKETDPPMPCAVPLPSDCQCFDQAFVDKMDGYDDRTAAPSSATLCETTADRDYAWETSSAGDTVTRYMFAAEGGGGYNRCWAYAGTGSPYQYARRVAGISVESVAACRALIASAPVCN